MKRIITTAILGLLLVSGITAQTGIKVPLFQGKDVVVSFIGSGYPTISVSDGIANSYVYKFEKGYDKIDVPLTLASTFTQLRNQNYKLVTSTSGSDGTSGHIVSYYIFQKD